jgi:hypothetical protein
MYTPIRLAAAGAALAGTPDNVLPGGLHPTDAGASVVFARIYARIRERDG